MSRTNFKEFIIGQEDIVANIHNQAFKSWIYSLGSLYGYKIIDSSDVKEWIKEENSKILIAYFDGKPVAYIHFKLEKITDSSPINQMVVIETKESLGQSKIAVLPKYQKKGIGTELIISAINYFSNIDTALILAYSDNIPMKIIMEKLGFKHEKLMILENYSETEPFANDSVLASINLLDKLPTINTNADVKVRPIEKKDYQSMRKIFGKSRSDVFGENPTTENIKEWIESGWGEVTLVAEINGKVVGCMEFTKEGVIGIPGVLPSYRKKGIGSTLFYFLLKKMKELGYSKALADTGYQLEDAIKMYRRFNFDLSRDLCSWIKIV